MTNKLPFFQLFPEQDNPCEPGSQDISCCDKREKDGGTLGSSKQQNKQICKTVCSAGDHSQEAGLHVCMPYKADNKQDQRHDPGGKQHKVRLIHPRIMQLMVFLHHRADAVANQSSDAKSSINQIQEVSENVNIAVEETAKGVCDVADTVIHLISDVHEIGDEAEENRELSNRLKEEVNKFKDNE